MKKTDFIRYVKGIVKPLSIADQIQTLEKMKIWLDEFLEEKKGNTILCSNCNKRSIKSKFKIVSQHEIRNQTIYIDAGYGEDDTHGDVEYLITYSICPCCGNKTEIERIYLKTLSEYTRDGRKIR